MIAAAELYPGFNQWLQLVPMPPPFRLRLLFAMAVDFFGCLALEKLCYLIFFDARPKIQRLLQPTA